MNSLGVSSRRTLLARERPKFSITNLHAALPPPSGESTVSTRAAGQTPNELLRTQMISMDYRLLQALGDGKHVRKTLIPDLIDGDLAPSPPKPGFLQSIKCPVVQSGAFEEGSWVRPARGTDTARHKLDDNFWFTFVHEAGHVLTSPRRREFIDPADPESFEDSDADEEDGEPVRSIQFAATR